MEFEVLLTIFVLLGIVALILRLFCRAVHVVVKLLGNSLTGLVLLLLVHFFGGAFGVHVPLHIFTIAAALIGGVIGTGAVTLFYLFF